MRTLIYIIFFVLTISCSSDNNSVNLNDANYPPDAVFCNNIITEVVDVTNPITGKTWMDRNLGATRAAIVPNDSESYGHYYQWGRRSDGHQCLDSGTTNVLSVSDTPTHDKVIRSSNTAIYDWRDPKNDNLWQGVNGINNPCPIGYRLPTAEEFEEEIQSWSSRNFNGAFESPLKLPVAGFRGLDGLFYGRGTRGNYWTSTVDGDASKVFYFDSDYASSSSATSRIALKCVRCIKD